MRKTLFTLLILGYIHGFSQLPPDSESPEPFVQAFIEQGEQYGKKLRSKAEKIQITFGDLPKGKAAASYPKRNPQEIIIDSVSWNHMDSYQKETLMFHELAHCVLLRSHRNDILLRGECASLLVDNAEKRGCNVDYYSETWRRYYREELFSNNPKLPAWYSLAQDLKLSRKPIPIWDTTFTETLFKEGLAFAPGESYQFTWELGAKPSKYDQVQIGWEHIEILIDLDRSIISVFANRPRKSLGRMIPKIFSSKFSKNDSRTLTLRKENGFYFLFLGDKCLYMGKDDSMEAIDYRMLTLSMATEVESKLRIERFSHN